MRIDPQGPLAGLRVLDASRVLAGPFCGQMLGDLGAEVIKVEHPRVGDETRLWGPPFAGELSAYYLSCNRNKRAITLDLAKPEGLRIFYDLVGKSDVLLENFRGPSAQRLGLSTDKLLEINPRIVICMITGFGRTGPMSHLPGYDFAIQALSGFMSITGPPAGPPYKVGVAVADILTGMHATVGVLACLRAREKSGHGYAIDLALLDCAVASQVNVLQAYLTSGALAARQGNAHLQIVPYQLFETADSWLVLAVGNDGQWGRFCQAAEARELAEDDRFATNTLRLENRTVLVPLVEQLLKTRSTEAWQRLLQSADVPHAPVWNYDNLFAEPQALARKLRVTVRDPQGRPVDLIGTPFHIQGTTLPEPTVPPAWGGHTNEVLQGVLGLSEEQIAELREKAII